MSRQSRRWTGERDGGLTNDRHDFSLFLCDSFVFISDGAREHCLREPRLREGGGMVWCVRDTPYLNYCYRHASCLSNAVLLLRWCTRDFSFDFGEACGR